MICTMRVRNASFRNASARANESGSIGVSPAANGKPVMAGTTASANMLCSWPGDRSGAMTPRIPLDHLYHLRGVARPRFAASGSGRAPALVATLSFTSVASVLDRAHWRQPTGPAPGRRSLRQREVGRHARHTVRFGVLGAARIAPAALLGPANLDPEASVEEVAARDRPRAEAYAAARIPRVAGTTRRSSATPTSTPSTCPSPMASTPSGPWPRWMPGNMSSARSPSPPMPPRRPRRRRGRRAAAGRLVVLEAFHYRYHPLAHRMLEIVESGELGDCTTSRPGCARRSPTSPTSGTN